MRKDWKSDGFLVSPYRLFETLKQRPSNNDKSTIFPMINFKNIRVPSDTILPTKKEIDGQDNSLSEIVPSKEVYSQLLSKIEESREQLQTPLIKKTKVQDFNESVNNEKKSTSASNQNLESSSNSSFELDYFQSIIESSSHVIKKITKVKKLRKSKKKLKKIEVISQAMQQTLTKEFKSDYERRLVLSLRKDILAKRKLMITIKQFAGRRSQVSSQIKEKKFAFENLMISQYEKQVSINVKKNLEFGNISSQIYDPIYRIIEISQNEIAKKQK